MFLRWVAASSCGLLLVGLLAACGEAGRSSDLVPHEGDIPLDWDHWFPNAQPASSADLLPATLGFAAVKPPSAFGKIRGTYLSPAGDAIAFVLDNPTQGRLVVVESRPDQPDPDARLKSYENQVAQAADPAVQGSAEVLYLGTAQTPALLSTNADGARSMIEFVLGGVQFTILGPSLGKAQAQSDAGAVAAVA